MDEVIEKFKLFYNELTNLNIKINSISSDSEFNNSTIINFCDSNNIKYYFFIAKNEHIIKNSNPLGIIDRWTRTLKSYLEKYLFKIKSKDWIKNIHIVNNLYNDLPHKGINNFSPNEIFQNTNLKKIDSSNQKIHAFNIMDFVRIKTPKNIFDKEGKNYTEEVYMIEDINNNKYKLLDKFLIPLNRFYKESELLKSNHSF